MVAKGRISTNSQGKTTLYLPISLVNDSAFPIKDGDEVTIEIRGKCLVVS